MAEALVQLADSHLITFLQDYFFIPNKEAVHNSFSSEIPSLQSHHIIDLPYYDTFDRENESL